MLLISMHYLECVVPEVHSLAAEIARVHRISLDKIKAKLTEVLLSVCMYIHVLLKLSTTL